MAACITVSPIYATAKIDAIIARSVGPCSETSTVLSYLEFCRLSNECSIFLMIPSRDLDYVKPSRSILPSRSSFAASSRYHLYPRRNSDQTSSMIRADLGEGKPPGRHHGMAHAFAIFERFPPSAPDSMPNHFNEMRSSFPQAAAEDRLLDRLKNSQSPVSIDPPAVSPNNALAASSLMMMSLSVSSSPKATPKKGGGLAEGPALVVFSGGTAFNGVAGGVMMSVSGCE